MEAPAHDVVETAGGHAVERAPHHAERLRAAAPQQQLERRRRRELRRRAEPAERGLVVAGQVALRRVEQRRRELGVARRQPGGAAERVDELLRLRLELVAALAPRLRDRLQQLPEARDPVTRLRREVRARVERSPVGRQEHRGRPAALAGHRHARVHRQRVDVGALLPVDLHVHEEVVHDLRRRGVGERLVLHHVAPVARAVADRDEERPVLGPRSLERLVAPRVPVDRVRGVLEEVRAGRAGEAVHALCSTRTRPFLRPAGVVWSRA